MRDRTSFIRAAALVLGIALMIYLLRLGPNRRVLLVPPRGVLRVRCDHSRRLTTRRSHHPGFGHVPVTFQRVTATFSVNTS